MGTEIKEWGWKKTDDVDPYYIFSINGEKLAVVSFMGGHVERPDYWHINFKDKFERGSAHSFIAAKERVEEYYSIQWIET